MNLHKVIEDVLASGRGEDVLIQLAQRLYPEVCEDPSPVPQAGGVLRGTLTRYRIEEAENWRGWCDSMPFLPFPSSWEVRILPPFGGALARFSVRKRGGTRTVSVYFDAYGTLGAATDYWEVFCGEMSAYHTHRFYRGEVPQLMACIQDQLDGIPAKRCEGCSSEWSELHPHPTKEGEFLCEDCLNGGEDEDEDSTVDAA